MSVSSYFSNGGRFLLIVAALVVPGALIRGEELVARVAAVVNGEAILTTQVDKEIAATVVALRNTGQQVPAPGVLYDEVLEHLIDESLQQQRARQLAITISDEDVETAIARLLTQFPGQTLEQYLANQSIDKETLWEEIRNDLAINTAIFQDNRADLRVNSSQVDQMLRAKLAAPELTEHLVEHALLSPDQEDVAAQMSAVAGDDFAELAQEMSISAEGVTLGWRTEQELPTQFTEAIRELRPGEVSKVMVLPNGLHVIHLVASRPLIPSHSSIGTIKLQLLTLPADTSTASIEAMILAIITGEQSMEESAAALGGTVEIVEMQETELSQEIKRNLRLRVGELGGPFQYGAGKAIVHVLSLETKIDDEQELRSQASALVADDSYLEARQKWLEYLHSIGTVEIVRADP